MPHGNITPQTRITPDIMLYIVMNNSRQAGNGVGKGCIGTGNSQLSVAQHKHAQQSRLIIAPIVGMDMRGLGEGARAIIETDTLGIYAPVFCDGEKWVM